MDRFRHESPFDLVFSKKKNEIETVKVFVETVIKNIQHTNENNTVSEKESSYNYYTKAIFKIDDYNDTLFSRTSMNGLTDIVKCIYKYLIELEKCKLIDRRMIYDYINKRNVYGETPYILACANGHIGTVETLVKYCKVDLTVRKNGRIRGSDYVSKQKYGQFKAWLRQQEKNALQQS